MKKAFTLIELLIVVAIIAILAAIAVPNFLEAQVRAKVSRVLSDQRTYSTALETYYIDNNSYPLHFPYGAVTNQVAVPAGLTKNYNNQVLTQANNATEAAKWAAGANGIPTFAVGNATAAIGLTSPVSYLNTQVPDTFGNAKQATFAYAQGPAGFLVWSPGPDGDDSLGVGHNAEWLLHGGQSLPNSTLIAGPPAPTGGVTGVTGTKSFTYDATNGTGSVGDVYKTKG